MEMKTHKTHIISMVVDDEPGVLTRISGLFSRRGFNIETITVGKSSHTRESKIVITSYGNDRTLEQIEKQVGKLIDVKRISELRPETSVVRELCLIKVSISKTGSKEELMHYASVYKAPVVDITPKSAIIQLLGKPEKIDAFIELIRPLGIKDMSRTGVTAIARGNNGA